MSRESTNDAKASEGRERGKGEVGDRGFRRAAKGESFP